MGVIKHGILGGFRKKTGTVIGAYWRTLDVIRALPRRSGKAATQAQLEQQQKFALVTAFLGNFSELIEVGFMATLPATPMNEAVAYHLKEAITGTSPDYAIDLPKFRFSAGKVELPDPITASAIPGSKIRFEWDGNQIVEGKFIDPSDKLTVLAYNPLKEKFVKVFAATTRDMGEYDLKLPASFEGDTVHLYISFVSGIKKLNSNSFYVGTAIVTAPHPAV